MPTDRRTLASFISRMWYRHGVVRRTAYRTTWKLRLVVLLLLVLLVAGSRTLWVPVIGKSLVCNADLQKSDAIVVLDFDPAYPLFERAASLKRAGLGSRIVATVQAATPVATEASDIGGDVARLMGQRAGIGELELLPISLQEPITLNSALRARELLERDGARSVLLVSAGFRSYRDYLAYSAVLAPAGISVRCAPVFDGPTPETWTATLHGIEDVLLQQVKLQVLSVLRPPPVHARPSSATSLTSAAATVFVRAGRRARQPERFAAIRRPAPARRRSTSTSPTSQHSRDSWRRRPGPRPAEAGLYSQHE